MSHKKERNKNYHRMGKHDIFAVSGVPTIRMSGAVRQKISLHVLPGRQSHRISVRAIDSARSKYNPAFLAKQMAEVRKILKLA